MVSRLSVQMWGIRVMLVAVTVLVAVASLMALQAAGFVIFIKQFDQGSLTGFSTSTVINNEPFFGVTDHDLGTRQLWKSNGTTGRTRLVKDDVSFDPNSFANVNVAGTVFFVGHDEAHGDELWRSDGTPEGTALVIDLRPGTDGGMLDCNRKYCATTSLVAIGTTLFFGATDGQHGFELWKSDGTAAGTALVKDLVPGSQGSLIRKLINVNGTLFFTYVDEQGQPALGKTDGTANGAVRVAAINAIELCNVDGTLFFSSYDAAGLWKTDGTPRGTQLIAPMLAGDLTAVKGTLFFITSGRTTDGVLNYQLWKSDGTTTGTVLVADPTSTSISEEIVDLRNVQGILFFRASTTTGDTALWKSDGTPSGTIQLTSGGAIQLLAAIDGTVFFESIQNCPNQELCLWASDGTSAGTAEIEGIHDPTILGVAGTYVLINSHSGLVDRLYVLPRPGIKLFLPLLER